MKIRLRIGIIQCKPLVWVLDRIFWTINAMPPFRGSWQIMGWIMAHTPADEDERK